MVYRGFDSYRFLPYLFVISFVSLFGILTLIPRSDSLGMFVAVLGVLVFIYGALRWPSLGLILLIAYSLRAIVALLGYYVIEIPEATADAVVFDAFAVAAAEGGLTGILDSFTAGSYFFAWLIGVLYWVVGYAPLLGIFVNVLFGTGVVANVYLLAREFRSKKFARVTALVAAVFPVLLMYSAVLLREAGWVFFFTLALLLFTKWYKQPGRIELLFGSMCLGVITGMFHSYGAVMLAVLFVFALIALARITSNGPARKRASLAAMGLLSALALGVVMTGIGMGKVGFEDFNLTWLTGFQELATRGRAAYPEFLIISSWPEMLWKLPARITYLLFTPFPWMFDSPLDLIGGADAFLYLVLIVVLATHVKTVRQDSGLWPLAVLLLVLIVVASLTVGNYGTALRHRAKFVVLLIILIPTERFTEPVMNRLLEAWTTIKEKAFSRNGKPDPLYGKSEHPID